MSENPNPTRCGSCGTMNPPGQEFCVKCHAPLTIAADSPAVAETPEAEDELRDLESPPTDERPAPEPTGGGPLPAEAIPQEGDEGA